MFVVDSYQESGRAGRDGENADCILYYSYKDKNVLENMIIKSSQNPSSASTRRKIDQLYMCVRYCEDECRCRRTMQLEFFGENFDRNKCNKTCDNCKAGKEPERRDMTEAAKKIINLLEEAIKDRRKLGGVTMLQLTELFRGSKSKAATKSFNISRLRGYGSGSNFKKHEIERITHTMIFQRLLTEQSTENNGGYLSDYVVPGEKAHLVQYSNQPFFVEFPLARQTGKENNLKSTKKANKASSKTKTKKRGTANPALSNGPEDANTQGGLQFEESSTAQSVNSETKSDDGRSNGASRSTLPTEHQAALVQVIQKLNRLWAAEERLLGKNVQCKCHLRVMLTLFLHQNLP